MPEIVGVQCPFREGQEEAARQFLAQPAAVPDLRISSRFLRFPYVMVAMFGVAFFVAVYLVMSIFYGFEWYDFRNYVIVCSAIAVAIGGLYHVVNWKEGNPMRVCGADGAIYQGRHKLASFDDIGVPRRVRKTHVIQVDDEPQRTVIRDVIEFARHRQVPLVLFDQELPIDVWGNMDEIAEHINAIIAEYHQRKAVRRWLEHRDAQSIPSRGYR